MGEFNVDRIHIRILDEVVKILVSLIDDWSPTSFSLSVDR